ncbi:hypothetical protein HMPREF9696_01743 [Afipia clevelandensis ATCC 49720]|uniref:Uncharacterized protein n=2 Tax=Afipia clevelandensis TaxID=1034 RepID=K8PHI6_9BRAD|nr:hypothetical protein HMPREF9696_01743 [Afipia clevelandensis ATCC 49720]
MQSSSSENDHRGQQSAPVVSGRTFNWPKALLVRRLKQNTWHADVSFAAEPTDAELDALGAFLRDNHKHVRAVNSHEALVKALDECQRALAMMVQPSAIKATSSMNAWTIAVMAEASARAALASAREVQQ